MSWKDIVKGEKEYTSYLEEIEKNRKYARKNI